MPRTPNPNSKTPRISIVARTEEQRMKLRGLREIFSRDDPGAMQNELWQAVDWLLAKHNYPPGNSQTQLPTFVEKQLVEKRCEHPGCHEIAQYVDYPYPPGKEKIYSCVAHHTHALENRLLKKNKPL